jgi:CDP-glycerol glycerophosphotransferase (TagB/SpsB family)
VDLTPSQRIELHARRARGLPRKAKTRVGQLLRRRLTRPPVFPPEYEVGNVSLPAEVVVYFADDVRRSYQLTQWLPILEQLDRHHSVLLVMRNPTMFRSTFRMTALRAVCVRRFLQLMALYDTNDYKVGIYVNNGLQNFQSLASTRMMHIHVNHGESDKISMVSHQLRAYDRVFVAGQAAVDRHRVALMEFEEERLIRVGRPQLDLDFTPALPPSQRRTVVYAPTWAGENEANNYSSVDRYGAQIVTAALSLPDVRLVYRPHPRIATSKDAAVLAAHAEICELINGDLLRAPDAGHLVSLEGEMQPLFMAADAMVTDIGSAALDFLYLRTDKPIFLTDRESDRENLRNESAMATACDIVDTATIDNLAEMLDKRLAHDELQTERQRMRRYYFGDLAVGESIQRFIDAVDEAVQTRDRLLQGRPIHPLTAA